MDNFTKLLNALTHRRVGYGLGTVTFADAFQVAASLLRGEPVRDGPWVTRYEEAVARYLHCREAVALGAARMGMYLVIKAMDWAEGDEIILPGYNCVVIPNAIRHAGLEPVYVDVRRCDYNIDPERIPRAITPRTRAIVVQHTFGIPCDMNAMADISRRYGLPVIEDGAHALGARLDERCLGVYGLAAFFSTESSKMLATEKGGLLATNDADLGRRLRELAERIPFRRPEIERTNAWRFCYRSVRGAPDVELFLRSAELAERAFGGGPIRRLLTFDQHEYQAEIEGRRYEYYPCRLGNLMCRAGLRQVERLEADVQRRVRLAAYLERILPGKGAEVPQYDHQRCRPSFVRYPFIVRDRDGWSRRLRAAGLTPGVWLDSPIHPLGCNLDFARYRWGMCPQAEWISRHILNVPVHPRTRLSDLREIEHFPPGRLPE